MKYSSDDGESYYHLGPDYSQKTAETIDREIKQLIEQAYQKVKDLIEANRDKAEALTQALLKYETLDADDCQGDFGRRDAG